MSKLPEGTTQAQWDRYDKDVAEFEKMMRACEPPKEEMPSLWQEWLKSYSMGYPNYRANND